MNIFYINNLIDSYLELFSKEFSESNFYNVSFDEFTQKIDSIKYDFQKRDNNLLIISKKFFNEEKHSLLRREFIDKLNLNILPHILFISDDVVSNKEIQKIIDSQNFIYIFHEKNIYESHYLHLYMAIIQERIRDLIRLNTYIIDSFKTIVNNELIKIQKKKIEILSKTDVLTKVLNRRALFKALEAEKKRTFRTRSRLENLEKERKDEILKKKKLDLKNLDEYLGRMSCLMIDLDSFKSINDNYGHLIGDVVLRTIGKKLNENKIFRQNDIIGRYGGEEFLIALPDTNCTNAKISAERLRLSIKRTKFTDSLGNKINVTISIGISEIRIEDKNFEEALKRADKALYYAKAHGKDQTVIFEEVFLE